MRRLLISRLRRQQNSSCRLIQRTAVYGPVRTVVWEGEELRGSPLSRLTLFPFGRRPHVTTPHLPHPACASGASRRPSSNA